MNELLEKLQVYGADTKGIEERFLGDKDLYNTCLKVFLEDECFLKLGAALSEMSYEKAFEYAHTLKGVAGNMGLTPIYEVICNMVESLRKKEYSGLQCDYKEVILQLEKIKNL